MPVDLPPPLLGVSVPPLEGAYGHDLAENARFPTWPCRFSPMRAYRPLIEARRGGFQACRVFLCEGAEGLTLDDEGELTGVSARLLESVSIVQEAARLHGLHLYWTVFDAPSCIEQEDQVTRSVLSDEAWTVRAAERVITPLVEAFDPELSVAVEVVARPDAVAPSVGWERLGPAIGRLGDAVRAAGLLATAAVPSAAVEALLGADARPDLLDIHAGEEGVVDRDVLARIRGAGGLLERPVIYSGLRADELAETELRALTEAGGLVFLEAPASPAAP